MYSREDLKFQRCLKLQHQKTKRAWKVDTILNWNYNEFTTQIYWASFVVVVVVNIVVVVFIFFVAVHNWLVIVKTQRNSTQLKATLKAYNLTQLT